MFHVRHELVERYGGYGQSAAIPGQLVIGGMKRVDLKKHRRGIGADLRKCGQL
jgi:hypothetical protein